MESCFRFSIIESVFGIHIYFLIFSRLWTDTVQGEKKCHVIVFYCNLWIAKEEDKEGFIDGL